VPLGSSCTGLGSALSWVSEIRVSFSAACVNSGMGSMSSFVKAVDEEQEEAKEKEQ
jgi:hypothetical protein